MPLRVDRIEDLGSVIVGGGGPYDIEYFNGWVYGVYTPDRGTDQRLVPVYRLFRTETNTLSIGVRTRVQVDLPAIPLGDLIVVGAALARERNNTMQLRVQYNQPGFTTLQIVIAGTVLALATLVTAGGAIVAYGPGLIPTLGFFGANSLTGFTLFGGGALGGYVAAGSILINTAGMAGLFAPWFLLTAAGVGALSFGTASTLAAIALGYSALVDDADYDGARLTEITGGFQITKQDISHPDNNKYTPFGGTDASERDINSWYYMEAGFDTTAANFAQTKRVYEANSEAIANLLERQMSVPLLPNELALLEELQRDFPADQTAFLTAAFAAQRINLVTVNNQQTTRRRMSEQISLARQGTILYAIKRTDMAGQRFSVGTYNPNTDQVTFLTDGDITDKLAELGLQYPIGAQMTADDDSLYIVAGTQITDETVREESTQHLARIWLTDLEINSQESIDLFQGQAIVRSLTGALLGKTPYTFSLDGTLPTGLSFTPTDTGGLISGQVSTTALPRLYTLTYTVTDANSATAVTTFTIRVYRRPTLTVPNYTIPLGASRRLPIPPVANVIDRNVSYSANVEGTLPPGMLFSQLNDWIFGTARTAGTYPLEAVATRGALPGTPTHPPQLRDDFTITVEAATLRSASISVDNRRPDSGSFVNLRASHTPSSGVGTIEYEFQHSLVSIGPWTTFQERSTDSTASYSQTSGTRHFRVRAYQGSTVVTSPSVSVMWIVPVTTTPTLPTPQDFTFTEGVNIGRQQLPAVLNPEPGVTYRYRTLNRPPGIFFTSSSRELNGTPSDVTSDITRTVSYIAVGGGRTLRTSFDITVLNFEAPPDPSVSLSASATDLQVGTDLVLTAIPANVVVPTYQFQTRTSPTASWTNLGTTQSPNIYTVASPTIATTRYYRVQMIVAGTTYDSNEIEVIWTAVPTTPTLTATITVSPTNPVANSNVALVGTLSNPDRALGYTFQVADASTGPWSNIAAESTTNVISAAGHPAGTTKYYRVQIRTSTAGTVASPPRSATWQSPPAGAVLSIASGPYYVGVSTTLTCNFTAGGSETPIRYAFQSGISSLDIWSLIGGSSINTTAFSASIRFTHRVTQPVEYRCIVTHTDGSTTSNIIEIEWENSPGLPPPSETTTSLTGSIDTVNPFLRGERDTRVLVPNRRLPYGRDGYNIYVRVIVGADIFTGDLTRQAYGFLIDNSKPSLPGDTTRLSGIFAASVYRNPRLFPDPNNRFLDIHEFSSDDNVQTVTVALPIETTRTTELTRTYTYKLYYYNLTLNPAYPWVIYHPNIFAENPELSRRPENQWDTYFRTLTPRTLQISVTWYPFASFTQTIADRLWLFPNEPLNVSSQVSGGSPPHDSQIWYDALPLGVEESFAVGSYAYSFLDGTVGEGLPGFFAIHLRSTDNEGFLTVRDIEVQILRGTRAPTDQPTPRRPASLNLPPDF